MDDLISRQAAIDALDCINGVEEVLKSLPSAQPEIVRCKDCYHYPSKYADCPMIGWARNENDFCSKAERKDDGRLD